MVGRAARVMMQDPEEYARKNVEFFNKLQDAEWQVKNPFQYRMIQGSVPLTIGSFGLSTATQFMPENETIQNLNNLNTWVVNPIIDSGVEYIVNRNISGMSPVKAGALAVGSGAGMLTGQLIGSQLFKDEEGNSNPLVTSISGMIGDVAGDFVSEKLWENKASRDFIKRASINLARHLGRIM